MNEQIVINTSPLIALGKMQIFDLVAQLPFTFICPEQVEAEISVGESQGHRVHLPSWITVVALQAALTPLASLTLDDGEAAVIQLALEQKIATVCIDEIKGRRCRCWVTSDRVARFIGQSKSPGIDNYCATAHRTGAAKRHLLRQQSDRNLPESYGRVTAII